ncbi:respiratory nitrate reductase subunit gamma [Desulfomonile tiedjei]|uniref:nitrate reductase (quinone) n=1 Tax=Desulfomonile tiedjei (strain ATCC 49306 / DSM 6799 / DCB-1) TaxID=706587 RepID=I4C294_DESTA|nr:respiratory nitrate reductase subunit gamma [Desulfomonile tiedjei]AFM23685.1 respiratory nitrate reductase gamma subunit [Desulfomonile tiedjei DSM 6799]
MDTKLLNTLAFLVFPYLALTIFFVGHPYRYFTDQYRWNSKSSELLEKENMKYGIIFFHWGIIFTLLGHLSGLMTPQWFLDRIGISAHAHDIIALYTGMLFGAATVIGLLLLLWRRLSYPRLRATSSANDVFVLILLLIVAGLGTYLPFFERYDVLYTIAPWIRSIVTFTPNPDLMLQVPWPYKIHILAALGLLGYSPFTRLVHIWSVPFTYFLRPYISYRRRVTRIA